MLTRIPLPWTNVYGLARTLVALGTAGTLAFSSTATLFRPVVGLGDHPGCTGVRSVGAFCLVPQDRINWVQWACVAVLLIVASGWRPRITAVPHAYLAFSVYTGIAIGDGGDQMATVLALALVLPALGDKRRWHWQPPGPTDTSRIAWALIGISALFMARIQMSFVYFQAAVAKLPHAEWADGTGMYYWMNSITFGAPGWLRPLVLPAVSTPLGTALVTWVPLLIEISLAATLLLPQRARWALLTAGIAFHLSTAVLMGLWSFALSMCGGLVLLCVPLGGTLYRPQTPPAERGEADDDAETDEAGVSARQSLTSSTISGSDKPASRASVTS